MLYQKYDVFHALPFCQNVKKSIYDLKFFKLQQFQYLIKLLAMHCLQ